MPDLQMIKRLTASVRDVPDFPKPGIVFKDITPMLRDGALFRGAIDCLTELAAELRPDRVVGIDARGFIFGGAVADRIGAGFVPMRKRGKLPWITESASYALEYGDAVLEVHRDAFDPGDRVLLVDDLLATGGTSAAAVELTRRLGAQVIACHFVVELSFLPGRKMLDGVDTRSLLCY